MQTSPSTGGSASSVQSKAFARLRVSENSTDAIKKRMRTTFVDGRETKPRIFPPDFFAPGTSIYLLTTFQSASACCRRGKRDRSASTVSCVKTNTVQQASVGIEITRGIGGCTHTTTTTTGNECGGFASLGTT